MFLHCEAKSLTFMTVAMLCLSLGMTGQKGEREGHKHDVAQADFHCRGAAEELQSSKTPVAQADFHCRGATEF